MRSKNFTIARFTRMKFIQIDPRPELEGQTPSSRRKASFSSALAHNFLPTQSFSRDEKPFSSVEIIQVNETLQTRNKSKFAHGYELVIERNWCKKIIRPPNDCFQPNRNSSAFSTMLFLDCVCLPKQGSAATLKCML